MGTSPLACPASAERDYWDGQTLPSGLRKELLAGLRAHITLGAGPREEIPVRVPFTGGALGFLPRGNPHDVAIAVARARVAQRQWSQLTIRERGRILIRFQRLLLARQEQVLDLIQLETGKARRHAHEEIVDTVLVAQHYANHAAGYLRTHRRAAGLPLVTSAREYRQPVGVVGVISPWNFPLILGVTDVLAALMAGNAAVLRPDEQGSFTALWAASLLREVGLPRDVFQVITGEGPVLGPALVGSVDFMMFTGSTRTGRLIARQAAERLIPYSLELGGKNAMIVLEDADVDAAAAGLVRGAFAGAGQVCVSVERIYVHRSIVDRFAARVVELVRAMRLSADLSYGVDMGSLTTAGQLATTEAHVADAVAQGATVLVGGRHRPDIGPLFYEPTVLVGVTPAMRVCGEETFGPVVSLFRFDTVEEALARANDSSYGLNASIWSRSVRKASELATRIDCGSVNVNDVYAAAWTATAAPIGGMRESGVGRRHGAEGILKYTNAQTIAVQRWLPLACPAWMREELYARWLPRLVAFLRGVPGLR